MRHHGHQAATQVSVVSESNDAQLMGLDGVQGTFTQVVADAVTEGRLTGSVFAHRRHQLSQTHPFQGKPERKETRWEPAARLSAAPGTSPAAHAGQAPARVGAVPAPVAAGSSPVFPKQRGRLQHLLSLQRPQQGKLLILAHILSPCVSTLVTPSNEWEDGLGRAPLVDSSWS